MSSYMVNLDEPRLTRKIHAIQNGLRIQSSHLKLSVEI